MIKKVKVLAYSASSTIMALPAVAMAEGTTFSTGTYGLPGGSITEIIMGILNFLLMIVGAIGVIGFLIAGILYLTAAGDEDRIKKAKSAMLYSIIGVIVALAGIVAIRAAQGILAGSAGEGTIPTGE